MADVIATAFVSIQAQLDRGFRKNVRDKVAASVGKGITVPLTPAITPFRAKLQAEIRKSPFLVPVKPNVEIGKFRAELKKRVDQAAKGVIVRVPVETLRGGVATRGGGTGGGGTAKLTDEEKALASQEKLLTDLAQRRAAAQGRLDIATRKGLQVDSQLRSVQAGLSEIEKGLTTTIRAEATARAANNTELVAELTTRKEGLVLLGQQLNLRKNDLAAEVKSAATASAFATAQTAANEALAVNVKEIGSRADLANLNNKLLSAESDLHTLNAKALVAEDEALAANTSALLANIATRKTEIETQRASLASASKLQTQTKTAARGGISTALAALGARGATLAAGGEFLAGAAAVAITAKAIGSAADLEKQLNILRVTSRATAAEMREVQAASVELGRDVRLPGVSASDAAKSMLQLVRAGLSIQDAIAGARGTLELATAAEIDFADAGNLVASALNAFALSGADAVHVADLLTNAANESQGEITDVGIALQQSAGAASLVGVSLDDTIALLTLLSRAGLKGSDAGTSLRTAFIKLINPTKKASEVLKELNVNVRDSQGNVRPEVFAEFARAQENLTRKEQQRNIGIVFGTDALRAQALIGRQGIEGLNNVRTALEREGSAQELAGAQAEGLTGKISALSSNLETLGTTLGTFTLPPLKVFVDVLNDGVSSINDVLGVIPKVTAQIKGSGDEAGQATPKWRKLAGAVLDFTKAAGKAAAHQGVEKLKQGIDPTRVPRQEIRQGIQLTGLDRFLTQNKTAQDQLLKTRLEVEKLFRFLGQGPVSDTSLNQVLVTLGGIADKLSKGDANAQALGRSIRKLIADIIRTGQIPNEIDLKVALDPSQARTEGEKGAKAVLGGIQSAAPDFAQTWLDLFNLQPAIDNAVTQIKAAPFTATLSTKLAEAQAHGTDAQQIAILEQQRAAAAQREAQARVNPNLTNAQRNKQVAQAAADFKAADDAIQQILDKQKSDAEQAARDAKDKADKAKSAREKLDQAIIDGFDLNRQKAQNKITLAAATEGLGDDIKTNVFLKHLVILQIQRIKERVKTLELRKKAIQELTQILFGLNQDIKGLRTEAAKTINEQIRTGLELDIDFFQTTENKKGEINARERLIANLLKEINQIKKQKKLTIEQKNHLKELRNAVAEQVAAIKELKKEQDNVNKANADLAFAFLTTQQGFAANLLGNLLPSGAVGHTVADHLASGGSAKTSSGGGSSPTRVLPGARPGPAGPGGHERAHAGPSGGGGGGTVASFPDDLGIGASTGKGASPTAALSEAERLARAGRTGGFTAAQAATLVALMRQVVHLLAALDTKAKHPENKRQHAQTNASLDTHH